MQLFDNEHTWTWWKILRASSISAVISSVLIWLLITPAVINPVAGLLEFPSLLVPNLLIHALIAFPLLWFEIILIQYVRSHILPLASLRNAWFIFSTLLLASFFNGFVLGFVLPHLALPFAFQQAFAHLLICLTFATLTWFVLYQNRKTNLFKDQPEGRIHRRLGIILPLAILLILLSLSPGVQRWITYKIVGPPPRPSDEQVIAVLKTFPEGIRMKEETNGSSYYHVIYRVQATADQAIAYYDESLEQLHLDGSKGDPQTLIGGDGYPLAYSWSYDGCPLQGVDLSLMRDELHLFYHHGSFCD